MIDPPNLPANDTDGIEPEEESGAGYGNHAPDASEELGEVDKDAR